MCFLRRILIEHIRAYSALITSSGWKLMSGSQFPNWITGASIVRPQSRTSYNHVFQ